MKLLKTVTLCLALLLVLLILPSGVKAAEETDGIFTYEIANGEATITDCEEDVTGALVIPSVLSGCPVTTIGSHAFDYCRMTSLTIPDSVITIERDAFASCKMTTLTIPNSVVTIGSSAFGSCKALTTLTIPNSVVTIGSGAFSNCIKLETVTFGNGVEKVYSSAFHNCTELKAVHISDLTAWCNIQFSWDGSNPLKYAKNLYVNGELITDLVIPSDVTEIREYAFFGSGIKSVMIPGSVKSIGLAAFSECPSLTDVTIGEGVTTIGEQAFRLCPSLTNVTLPDSLIEIEKEAFWRCGELTNLTVGKGLKTVGKDAFRDCKKLDRLNISDVAAWCDIDFYDHYSNPLFYSQKMYLNGSLVKDLVIPNGVTVVRQYAFDNNRSVTSLTIPDSVTTIGAQAFSACIYLEKVTIGSGVTTVGESAFGDCTALKNVYISDLAAWCRIEFGSDLANPLFRADDFYVKGSAVKKLVIPDGVAKIGRYAFVCCRQLTSVELPDSLKHIDSNAFMWCESIANVYFNGSKEQWDSVTIGFDNDPLTNAKLHIRGARKTGDIDGVYGLNTNDAVYLLLSVMFGETDYPVPTGTNSDFNADGKLDTNDAVYLLLHIMFGAKDYPLPV